MFKYIENVLVIFMIVVVASGVFLFYYFVQEKEEFNSILNKIELEMTIDTESIYETREKIEDYIIKYPKNINKIKVLSNKFNEKLYDLHKKYDPEQDYKILVENLSTFFFGDDFLYIEEIENILSECSNCREEFTVASVQ